jgi:Tol biopolymer transport system component
MTPERWQRISALYSAAQRLPEDERHAFALEATAGDAELRTELLELLDSATPETDFLENPPLRLAPQAGSAAPPAPFEPGAVICEGRFRVEQVVGRGGMGRVYRAFDTSLGRVVALKTVAAPGALVEATGVRLRQEAALVSKLNHPGICTLYDLSRHEGMDIAVMEFVEGEPLASRLRSGLSQKVAIRTAIEILDALDYAHRRKVVHRDVKPGNVILTRSGAKLLDFGIAKLRTGDTQEEAEPAAGTPAYMAPEQRSRGPVDSRADIYSVGVMLTEMLTRRPGEPMTSASIDAIENPVLRRVVARCLSPEPDARWQAASDLREALELALMSIDAPPAAAVPERSNKIWGAVLAAAALMGVGAWAFWPAAAPAGSRVVEFRLGPPDDTEFPPVERAGPAAISPDGTLLAMAAQNKAGESALWLRRLDAATPVLLAGTEGASHPFWSPDGTQIGFFARGKLRTIPAAGGAARILCDAEQGRGGAWSRAGVIVFAPKLNDALYRVDQAGGRPTPVTYLDRAGEENSHRWPVFLPDSQRLLLVIRSATEGRSGLFVTSLDGEKPVKVGDVPSSAIFVADAKSGLDGQLLYVRGNQVLAQPFSLRRMKLESEPRTVAELAWNDATTSRSPISASDTGLLVYGGGYPDAFQLAWQSEGKTVEPAIDPGGAVRFLRLSPDARTAAIERLDFRTGAGSIWLVDTMRGTPSRLTFGPVAAFAPVWSRDGRSLLYTATPGGAFAITVAPAESGQAAGNDQPKELLRFGAEQPAIATDITADGTILLEVRDESSGWDIVAMKPGADPRRPAERVKLAEKPSDERQARVSPDDQWIAYVGNEGGSNQVYVMPLRGTGPRIQVSIGGGTQPIWGRTANELYFVASDRTLVKATIDYTARLAKVIPAGGPIPQLSIQGLMSGWEYGVTDNPERSVFAGVPVPRGSTESVVVLEGWQARLGR